MNKDLTAEEYLEKIKSGDLTADEFLQSLKTGKDPKVASVHFRNECVDCLAQPLFGIENCRNCYYFEVHRTGSIKPNLSLYMPKNGKDTDIVKGFIKNKYLKEYLPKKRRRII